MKDLITLMAQAVVDEPNRVTVTEIQGGQTTVYELKVAKMDVGKVIGKRGRTASALRTIVNAVAAKEHKRVILEIID